MYNTYSFNKKKNVLKDEDRKQTKESILKKEAGEPQWVRGITQSVLADSAKAISSGFIRSIEQTDDALTRWDNDLTQLNEMTKERKDQEHIKSFVTGMYPSVKINSPVNLEPKSATEPEKGTGYSSVDEYVSRLLGEKGDVTAKSAVYSGGMPTTVTNISHSQEDAKENIAGNLAEAQSFDNQDELTYGVQKFSARKTVGEFKDGFEKYGVKDTIAVGILSEKAKNMALDFARENEFYQYEKDGKYYQKGYNGGYYDSNGNAYYEIGKGKKVLVTWDNEADALRHSMWNSMMTRDLGYEKALFFANNHEIAELKRIGMFEKNEDGVITTKMNQPTLMDIWNNSTGRALAIDKNLNNVDYEELFNHALTHDMLITDATKAYEFYGVSDYINTEDWTVNVVWDTNKGTITFKKEGLPDKTMNVGRWAL